MPWGQFIPEPVEACWLIHLIMEPSPTLVPTPELFPETSLDYPILSGHLPTPWSPSPLLALSSTQDSLAPLVSRSSLALPPPQIPTNSLALPQVSFPSAKVFNTDPLASTQASRPMTPPRPVSPSAPPGSSCLLAQLWSSLSRVSPCSAKPPLLPWSLKPSSSPAIRSVSPSVMLGYAQGSVHETQHSSALTPPSVNSAMVFPSISSSCFLSFALNPLPGVCQPSARVLCSFIVFLFMCLGFLYIIFSVFHDLNYFLFVYIVTHYCVTLCHYCQRWFSSVLCWFTSNVKVDSGIVLCVFNCG